MPPEWWITITEWRPMLLLFRNNASSQEVDTIKCMSKRRASNTSRGQEITRKFRNTQRANVKSQDSTWWWGSQEVTLASSRAFSSHTMGVLEDRAYLRAGYVGERLSTKRNQRVKLQCEPSTYRAELARLPRVWGQAQRILGQSGQQRKTLL